MITIDEKLKSMQQDLLDKMEGKVLGLSEIDAILDRVERIAQIRNLNRNL